MSKLTLTSTFASSITIGDPGVLAFTLKPKETKSVEVDEAQLRHLTPGLERLKAAKWINYTVVHPGVVAEAATPTTPPPAPAQTPAPEVPPPAPKVEVPPPAPKVETPPPEPDADGADAPPATEVPPAADPASTPPATEVPPVADSATTAPKSPLLDRKNRNR